MLCPKCYGKGERGSVEWNGVALCLECQGSGIVSCCDTAGSEFPWEAMGQDFDAARALLPREMTGFFAHLTEAQRRAVLAYRGEEGHGDPSFLG